MSSWPSRIHPFDCWIRACIERLFATLTVSPWYEPSLLWLTVTQASSWSCFSHTGVITIHLSEVSATTEKFSLFLQIKWFLERGRKPLEKKKIKDGEERIQKEKKKGHARKKQAGRNTTDFFSHDLRGVWASGLPGAILSGLGTYLGLSLNRSYYSSDAYFMEDQMREYEVLWRLLTCNECSENTY